MAQRQCLGPGFFAVANPNGEARLILDLSSWTDYYTTPPMRLNSAPEVLVTFPAAAKMIKFNLSSGFFQLQI
jgi:hypothetical protein